MLRTQSYQNAYRKFTDSYFTSPWFFPHAVLWKCRAYETAHPWNSQGQHMAWQVSSYSVSHLKSPGQPLHNSYRTQASTRENEALCEEEALESDADDKVECNLSNKEVTEEFCQYFTQTESHREERWRQQQLDTECLNGYMNVNHGLYFNNHRSVEPPSEKPREWYQAEMKHLHENSGLKILAMETAVQLSFDKHCDRKQLKYWPIFLLKF